MIASCTSSANTIAIMSFIIGSFLTSMVFAIALMAIGWRKRAEPRPFVGEVGES